MKFSNGVYAQVTFKDGSKSGYLPTVEVFMTVL